MFLIKKLKSSQFNEEYVPRGISMPYCHSFRVQYPFKKISVLGGLALWLY